MRVIAALLITILLLSCKKVKNEDVSSHGIYDAWALLSLNGQCVIELYIHTVNSSELKEYLKMDDDGTFAYACFNDSAQKLLSDTSQWNLDTLHISCRLPTAEELAMQCAKGKHIYITKVTNLSIINQGR